MASARDKPTKLAQRTHAWSRSSLWKLCAHFDRGWEAEGRKLPRSGCVRALTDAVLLSTVGCFLGEMMGFVARTAKKDMYDCTDGWLRVCGKGS